MDLAKYSRCLVDSLKGFATIPSLQEEVAEYVELAEPMIESSKGQKLIYKNTIDFFAQLAPRIFRKDQTILTDASVKLPDMFASYRSKFMELDEPKQRDMWKNWQEALVAVGLCRLPLQDPPSVDQAPPRPAPAPAPVPAPAPPALQNQAPPPPPAPSSMGSAKVQELKKYLDINPELGKTARAVQTCMQQNLKSLLKDPPASADAMKKLTPIGSEELMKQMKQMSEKNRDGPLGHDAADGGGGGGAGAGGMASMLTMCAPFLDLVNELMVEDEEEEKDPEGQKQGEEAGADKEVKDEEVQKSVQLLSLVQQFHLTFFRCYKHFTELLGESFPILVTKYNALTEHLKTVSNDEEERPVSAYTLLHGAAAFFNAHKKEIRERDESLWLHMTDPVLKECDSCSIWKAIETPEQKSEVWDWCEEIRMYALAAIICVGETGGFEAIAKDMLPAVAGLMLNPANSGAGGSKSENLVNGLVESMKQPARKRAIRQLIRNFVNNPDQVTKALDLIGAVLGEPEETPAAPPPIPPAGPQGATTPASSGSSSSSS